MSFARPASHVGRGDLQGSHAPAPLDERIFCIRGPSRSGKTSMAERLIDELADKGLRVGYLKRTHHTLDLPEKSSGRIWTHSPSAMVIHGADRIQLTLPGGDRSVPALARQFSTDEDVLLVETHSPEPYPTILAASETVDGEEDVMGRWEIATLDEDASRAASAILARLPGDLHLHRALRAAARHHGGHGCAGLILGTRLALHGAALLGIDVPDRQKRLVARVEIDRCAADAVQSVTGCRPGKRTLRLLDYGKLAATFIDQWEARAVRVAVRGDLRERAAGLALPGEDRRQTQRRVYLSLPNDALFSIYEASAEIDQFDRPGPPRRRAICGGCREEVSDGRDIATEDGPRCLPCAGAGVKGVQSR